MGQYDRNEQFGSGAFAGESSTRENEYRERPGRIRRSLNDTLESMSSLSRGGQVNQSNASQMQYQTSAATSYGSQYTSTSPAGNPQGSFVSPGGSTNGFGAQQTVGSTSGFGAQQTAGSTNGFGAQPAAAAKGYAWQQFGGNQSGYAGQQTQSGQNPQTNQTANNHSAYAGQQFSNGQNAFFNSQGGTAQASLAGSRQTNPAANIPASGRQRSAMPNTPFTRDRNRSTASGDSRVRDRRIPSDLSMREADISAAARKRQSEVIYGDALRTEVPMIQGTPSLYLRGTDGENRKVSVPFTNDLLSRHIMLLGGIGTGKTNAFFQMIDQLQHSLTDDDIMVIFDTKGDFYQEFFSPGDVVISNDKTSVGPNGRRNYWNIFNEVNNDYQYESVLEISKSLFAEECKRTTQIFFPNAARDIFMACFLHFLRSVPPKERTNKNLAVKF